MSTAALTPTPKMQFSDDEGVPLAGGFVFTYSAGTTTPLATFTDSTEAAQNTNPIVLDAGGFANIWLGANFYKFVVQDANGVQQYTTDNISAANLPFQTNVDFVEGASPTSAAGHDVLGGNVATHRLELSVNGGAADPVVTQNSTDDLFNKTLFEPVLHDPTIDALVSLNPSYLFSEEQTGVDWAARVMAAIGALPAAGGTVDSRNDTDAMGTGSVTVDPGSKSVTLLLGPATYNVTQIIARTNFHMIGMGSGEGIGGSKPPTLLQAKGNNATAPIIIAQTVSEGQEGIVLRGFRLQGSVGNTTQNGIVCSAPALGGLWYSEFDDIFMQNFGGTGLDLEGPLGGGLNQFSTFKRIIVFRTMGGGPGLKVVGYNNSLKFENCQFDGGVQTPGGDGLINILIDCVATGIFPPYNIKFDLLTSQWAGIAMQINAGDAISIDQGHFEGDWNAITLGTGAGGSFGPLNITVHDSFFGNGTGINAGNGSIINNTAATPNASLAIINSHVYAAPDVFLKGNLGSIAQYGCIIGPEGSYSYQTPRSPFILPQVVATLDLTAQTAAIVTQPLYTPAASGLFEVRLYMKVTTAAGSSSTLGMVTLAYTDATDSIAQSQVLALMTEAGAVSSIGNGLNTTACKLIGGVVLNAKIAVPIQYSITYASNPASAMNYEVHAKVIQLF